jgi:hypothetical protein
VVLVGEKGKRELELGLEPGLGLCAVGAGPEDDCIESPEPGEGVAKLARLDGSARGIGSRIEVEDDVVARELTERHGSPAVVGEHEVRCTIADREGHRATPPMSTAMMAF